MIITYGLDNHNLTVDKNIVLAPNNSKGTYKLELIATKDNQFDVFKIGFILNKDVTANAEKATFNGVSYTNISLNIVYDKGVITLTATDISNNSKLFSIKEKLESINIK